MANTMRFDDFYANVRTKYPTVSLAEVREAYKTAFDRDPVFETAPPRDQFRRNVATQYPDLTDDEIDTKYSDIYGDSLTSEAKRSVQRGLGGMAGLVGSGIQLLQDEIPDVAMALPVIGSFKQAADSVMPGGKIRDYWKEQIATVPRSAASQGDVEKAPLETLTNPSWWAAGAPEMIANQAATIGAFMLGGPVGAGLVGGGMEGLQTYGEAKEKGLENPGARGLGQGLASGALNAIPFAGGLGRGIGGFFARGAAEGVTEGLEEIPGTYLESPVSAWGDQKTLDTAINRGINIAPLAAVAGGLNPLGFPSQNTPTDQFADVANELRGPKAPEAAPAEIPTTFKPYTGETKTILPKAEVHRQGLISALEPIVSRWQNGPKVNYVQSFRDLPADIKARFDDSINGAYDGTDNVYLVADKFTSPAEAAKVLYHESLGHYGIEQIVPDIADFAAQVEQFAPKDPVLSKYWEGAQVDYANEEPLIKSLETVARYAEDFPNTKHPLVERLYARLREFGRNTLGLNINMNRADLNRALRKALRHLEQGTKEPTGGNQTGEMKAASPAIATKLDAVRGLPVVAAGESVDGRIVREDIPNTDSIPASFDEYTELPGVREIPMEWFDKDYISSVQKRGVDERTQKLADDINASGELNPLIVAFDSEGPYIVEGGHRLDALISMGAKSLPAKVVIDESNAPRASKAGDYRGPHKAPSPSYGAPLHDLTQIFPDDVYSADALTNYGDPQNAADRESIRVIQSMRGKPDKNVTIYRAVPKDAGDDINPGDFVSVSKRYVKDHGEGPLQGEYKIVSKRVPASQLYGSPDSLSEFGYHPPEQSSQPPTPKASKAVAQAEQPTFEERARQSIVRETEFSPQILDAYVALAKGQEGRIEGQRRGVQSWDKTARNAAELLASDMGYDHVASLVSAAPGTAANPESLIIMAGAVHEATQRVESAALEVTRDKSPANLARLKAAMDRLAFLQAPWMGFRAEAGRSLNILRKVAPIASDVNDLLDRYVHDEQGIANMADKIVKAKERADADDPSRGVSAEIVAVEAQEAQVAAEGQAIQQERTALQQERQAAAAETDPAAMDTEASALELLSDDLSAREAAAKSTESALRSEIDKLAKREADLEAAQLASDKQAEENKENREWLDANKAKLAEFRKQNSKDKSAIKRQMAALQERMQAELDARTKLDQQLKETAAKKAELDQRRKELSKGMGQVTAKMKRVDAALAKLAEREQALLKKQAELQAKKDELGQRRAALRKGAKKRGGTGKLVREQYTPTIGDKFMEYYYNSILSGPATHGANIMGNSAFMVTEEIAKQIGLWSTGQGKAAMARLGGISLGIQTGMLNAKNAFATELPQLDQQTKMEVDPALRAAIPGPVGKVIRTPGRALQAEDEFFKGIAYTMELAQLATQAAQGDHVKAREIMANPSPEMMKEAVLAARRVTFTNKVGPAAQSLMRFTQKVKPAKLIIPFIQTPVNITKRAMDYTPFGLAGLPFDTEIGNDLKGKNGKEKQAIAVTRQMMGAGLSLMLWQLAAAGLVTGGGPADPEERTLWRQRDGRDSYSVKIGDKWVSYLRFDPLAIPMGLMADLYETVGLVGEKDAGDIGISIMNSMVNNLANKTWLSGVSSFAQAINDPPRYGESFLGMVATGVAVPNIVGQTTNFNDPWVRQSRTILDRVRSRIPGERDELAKRVGISGEDMKNNGVTLAGIPTPLRASPATEVDPLADAMLRLGVIKKAPAANFMGVELEPEEHSDWQRTIQQQRWKTLTPIVQSPGFKAMSPIQQATMLEEMWDKLGSSQVTRAQFLMQHPDILDRVKARVIANAG